MSTNSMIAYKMRTGKYKSIFVHWDGDLRGNGTTLLIFHNTDQAARDIVALGDASVIHRYIAGSPNHSFEHPEQDVSIFYKRDRGERHTAPKIYESREEMAASFCCQYFYVREDGNWHVSTDYGRTYRLLSEAFGNVIPFNQLSDDKTRYFKMEYDQGRNVINQVGSFMAPRLVKNL